MDIYLERLKRRDIKPTAIRILTLKGIMKFERAFSLTDLENLLDTVDKSTLFRTLTLFLNHHLIHCIDDGSGSLKYSLCANECDCSVDDLHSHFYCVKCHKTFCLRDIPIPVVTLPEGFTLQSINYVLKGICSDCEKHLQASANEK
ncbi:transcriptional repressor [uncultured Bacteroides sp.]|uniref:Fur family transcriptional regulator n=1 Tax=uncultured Bacteroides sp. TaxID=162156 RepID=UPI002AAAD226|nr:transcriptional repressor [uncultured Bacteroides sp.]